MTVQAEKDMYETPFYRGLGLMTIEQDYWGRKTSRATSIAAYRLNVSPNNLVTFQNLVEPLNLQLLPRPSCSQRQLGGSLIDMAPLRPNRPRTSHVPAVNSMV